RSRSSATECRPAIWPNEGLGGAMAMIERRLAAAVMRGGAARYVLLTRDTLTTLWTVFFAPRLAWAASATPGINARTTALSATVCRNRFKACSPQTTSECTEFTHQRFR